MVDITHKSNTLRHAGAEAVVTVGSQETIEALKNNAVPKGNVFEVAKAAGLFAVKNTHLSIPDCHPLPIESTAISYQIEGLSIRIAVDVKTIYKTGVEVEAMHGASIVALTIYDMLKPIDKNVEIGRIHLMTKTGGKSQYKNVFSKDLTACVVVCSDSVFQGKKEDSAGQAIIEKLKVHRVKILSYEIIPDEVEAIRAKALEHSPHANLLIYTGGTGLSKRDVTPEALSPLLERRIPGIEEAIRNYGQQRTPYAMLSRSVAGFIGDCLTLALPGSTNGAKESMDAVFPDVLHIFKIINGGQH